MPRRLILATLVLLTLPGTAQAATLTGAGGVVTYTAAAGQANDITLSASGTTVVLTRNDSDVITATGTCNAVGGSPPQYFCSDAARVVVDVGDGNDTVSASAVASLPMAVSGGDGSDSLSGGGGNDALDGGAGDDALGGNGGADSLAGGDGIDTASFTGARATATVSLDGVANDGAAGENDNVGADVENVTASADQTVSLTGNDGPNRLVATGGKAAIAGGGGADILEGGPLDDTVDARDGTADTVLCGAGNDTALADTVDVVSPTCEVVQRFATPGGVGDDKPPTIAWTAPRRRATVSGNTATTLAVTATDDRGVAKVQFYDDDRRVCEDTTAPYSCSYRARGADVGRNTLIAVAFDGAGQTTAVFLPITVGRFKPSVRVASKPARDRSAPYSFTITGRVRLPSRVSAKLGCHGTVTVTAKAGSRTVSRRKLSLRHNRCTFRVRLRFGSRPAAKLKLGARFGGNQVLRARSARSRTVRTT